MLVASKIFKIIKSRSYYTKKFYLAKLIDLSNAFDAITVAGYEPPSSLLIVVVKATIIAFFKPGFKSSGSISSHMKPKVYSDASLIYGSW